MKIKRSVRKGVQTIGWLGILVLILAVLSSPASACLMQNKDYLSSPGNRIVLNNLFDTVNSATSFPFTLFPGLDGANNANFVEDDLINQDELIHTTVFLRGQVAVFSTYSSSIAAKAQALLDAALFLKREFAQFAGSWDSKGNQAVGKTGLRKKMLEDRNDRQRQPSRHNVTD